MPRPKSQHTREPAGSTAKLDKLFGFVESLHRLMDLLRHCLPRGFNTTRAKRRRRPARTRPLASLQALEARLCLAPVANNDTYYSPPDATLNIPAYAGVLANDTGGNGPLSAVLVSNPQ